MAVVAFPGAEGYGAGSLGCRAPGGGCVVLKVTNLNNSGDGSLRAALTDSRPRIVIPAIGGTVDLVMDQDIVITSPYLYYAGQAAPGGGLQSRYATIDFDSGAHDIIVRYMKHRRGWTKSDANPNYGPGFTFHSYGTPVYNAIVDHSSFGGQQDDNGVWNLVHDVTFQWSIFAEGNSAQDFTYTGGKCLTMGAESPNLGGNMYNISAHHNFISSCHQRSPFVTGGGPTEFDSNLIYNSGAYHSSSQTRGETTKINYMHNVLQYGPGTNQQRYEFLVGDAVPDQNDLQPNNSIYVLDNLGWHRSAGQPEWNIVGFCGTCAEAASTQFQKSTPYSTSAYPITMTNAADVPAVVTETVGANLPIRDAMDARLIDEYNTGTGTLGGQNDWPILASGTPPTDTDNDGMPDSYETANGFNPNSPTDATQTAANGYLNVENYLNGVSISGNPPDAPTHLRVHF